jgi:hypothetical protein
MKETAFFFTKLAINNAFMAQRIEEYKRDSIDSNNA